MGEEGGLGKEVPTHHSPSEEPHTEVKPEPDVTSPTESVSYILLAVYHMATICITTG